MNIIRFNIVAVRLRGALSTIPGMKFTTRGDTYSDCTVSDALQGCRGSLFNTVAGPAARNNITVSAGRYAVYYTGVDILPNVPLKFTGGYGGAAGVKTDGSPNLPGSYTSTPPDVATPPPPQHIASCVLNSGSTKGDLSLGNITYTGKNFDKASSQFIPGVTVIATCTGDVNNGSLQTNVGVTFSSRGVTGTSIPIPSHTAFSLVGLKGAGQNGTTLPSADTFCSSSNNSLRVIFGSRMPLGIPIPADSYSSMSRRWTYWFGVCSKQGAAANEIGSGPINIPVTYDVIAYS